MTAPFTSIREHGWAFAYDQTTVGPTSAFGVLVDHMAVSDATRIRTKQVQRLVTCFCPDEGTENTEVPITDHNAVKTTFDVGALLAEPAWYTGGPLPTTSA